MKFRKNVKNNFLNFNFFIEKTCGNDISHYENISESRNFDQKYKKTMNFTL